MVLPTGALAPDFTLRDQCGAPWRLSDRLRRGHGVLLVFYPLDWTPGAAAEVRALAARAGAFAARGVDVAALSVDSRESHEHWCASLGGIGLPVLSDFEPKGAVARAYGVMGDGVAAAATVLVGPDGKLRWAEVLPARGRRRNFDGLLTLVERLGFAPRLRPAAAADGAPPVAWTLYVDPACGHCQSVLALVRNLDVPGLRIVQSPSETERLAATGQLGVPALVGSDGTLLVGSHAIRKALLERYPRG